MTAHDPRDPRDDQDAAGLDQLELILRAMPFDERDALEARWVAEGTPPARRLAEAEAIARDLGDGCEL
jgi:hypothetical protein